MAATHSKRRASEIQAHKIVDSFETLFQHAFFNAARNWGPINDTNPIFVLGIIFMAAIEEARTYLAKHGVPHG